MFKNKASIVGLIAVLLLASCPVVGVQAEDLESAETVATIPAVPPDDVLGYYTSDGGKTWSPIKEQPGVAERIPKGLTREEFLDE